MSGRGKGTREKEDGRPTFDREKNKKKNLRKVVPSILWTGKLSYSFGVSICCERDIFRDEQGHGVVLVSRQH